MKKDNTILWIACIIGVLGALFRSMQYVLNQPSPGGLIAFVIHIAALITVSVCFAVDLNKKKKQ